MAKSAKSEAVMIGGIEYVPKGTAEPVNSDIKIVVLQRGWIAIGRYSEDGDDCRLQNAYIIRRWGTTSGLGELALEGKQADTVLDKAGVIDFHKLTVVAKISCKEELWQSELV